VETCLHSNCPFQKFTIRRNILLQFLERAMCRKRHRNVRCILCDSFASLRLNSFLDSKGRRGKRSIAAPFAIAIPTSQTKPYYFRWQGRSPSCRP